MIKTEVLLERLTLLKSTAKAIELTPEKADQDIFYQLLYQTLDKTINQLKTNPCHTPKIM